jgi:hypothetical protein
MGFTQSFSLRACGVTDEGDVYKRDDLREKAREIARKCFT